MKKKIYAIVVVTILIIVSLVGFMFLRNMQTYTFEEDVIYFENGTAYNIQAGKTAVLDSDDETVTINCGAANEGEDDFVVTPTTLPLYFKNRDALICMNKMQYVHFDSQGTLTINKINLFTEFAYNASEKNVSVSRYESAVNENGGILFDGDDTYVFLQEVTLTIGEDEITLSPMSYAIVNLNNYAQIYNYDSGDFESMNIRNEAVKATAADGSFELTLEIDVIAYGEGSNRQEMMLQSSAEIYDEYF